MKITKEILKNRYVKLDASEKKALSESLMKVNIGVPMPNDMKRVATFLKGSPFMAMKDNLTALIEFIHQKDLFRTEKDVTIVSRAHIFSESNVKALQDENTEDNVITESEGFDDMENTVKKKV